jgi:hypothetical protein
MLALLDALDTFASLAGMLVTRCSSAMRGSAASEPFGASESVGLVMICFLLSLRIGLRAVPCACGVLRRLYVAG